MSSSLPPVVIVGAGPTGLVLALRLARHGVPLRIVDRNPGPGLASRAMAVQARTLEFYDQLGLADEVIAQGIRMDAVHLREGGEEVARIRFNDLGAGLSPYPFALSYPQDDHERFLVSKLRDAGIEVEWGVELKGFTQDEQGVAAVLARVGTADDEPEVCQAAYLCGCDGAHSRVREGLGLAFPGGTYDQVFYVADVRLAGGGGDDLLANLGARSFGLVMPVRSTGMKRLIGIVPEALSDRHRLDFADIQPFIEPLMGIRVEQVNWFSTYHVHHRVAERFRVGRVFIAGDAGHIHSPAGGQGMNTGIGDAVNLSWKLAEVMQGRVDSSILDTYETERIAFARKLVETTDRAFQGMVSPSWGGQFMRTRLLPLIAPMATSVAAVRRAMFRTVSQIRIHYRESALSAGEAGEVHGGDRLPWVASGEGGNFASLRTLAWRIHVYGALDARLARAAAALGLPVDVFAWSEEAEAAGLRRDAFYLLRPDGHVSLSWPDQDADRLSAMVSTLGLSRA